MDAPEPTPLIFTRSLGNPHPHIKRRIETEYWHHRSQWMEGLLEGIVSWFTAVFGERYSVRILTSTGSGGREAYIANLLSKDDLAWTTTDSGFAPILVSLGIPTRVFDECGPLPMEAPAAVFLDAVSAEGVQSDLVSLTGRIRATCPETLIVVDASGSFGADAVAFDSILADGYLVVPERALGGIPGAVVLAFTDRIRSAVADVRAATSEKPYLFDLLKYDIAWEKKTTPYSPDISCDVSLAASLELIERNGGLAAHIARHAAYARIIRDGMEALGFTLAFPDAHASDAMTVFAAPASVDASALARSLDAARIGVDVLPERNLLAIGHMGFHDHASLSRFISTIANLLGRPIPPEAAPLTALSVPDAWDARIRESFSIAPSEFIALAASAATSAGYDQDIAKRMQASAERMFAIHADYDLYGCFKDRTVGFIGGGNTVRETVLRARAAGVKRMLIYSPSLAALVQNEPEHPRLAYWSTLGVEIAGSADEVLFTAHTVVLLPTLHTPESTRLLGKTLEYRNERMVDAALLARLKAEAKIDLLINASAREDLIDRDALASALTEGWLTYIADELPPPNDPILAAPNTFLTGHVGGSSALTKERIATNTRAILDTLIAELMGAEPQDASKEYCVNVLNVHLLPEAGAKRIVRPASLRILLTDAFDTGTLDIEGLGMRYGIPVSVRDLSREDMTEERVSEELRAFRPHLIMMRTRTIITKRLGEEAAASPDLLAIIRPGVGIDNIYGGMDALSAGGIRVLNEPHGNSFSVGEMTTHFILNGVRKALISPGPTEFNPEVFNVMHEYTYPHAGALAEAKRSVEEGLKVWLGIGPSIITHSVPSTGLMEAAIRNLTARDDRGLIIAHGKFGNRFIEIANATGRETVALQVADEDWGRAFTPEEIAQALEAEASPFSFLCLQQNETSSGVAYRQGHLEAIIGAARRHNPDIMIIMDGVSGIGAHAIDPQALDIDALVVGSQKAFGVSSGFTYASVSERAIASMLEASEYQSSLDALRTDPERETYLSAYDSKKEVRYLSMLRLLVEDASTREDVPSIFHLLSTKASLAEMEREGGKDAVVRRHQELASRTRQWVEDMKLSTLSHEPFVSDSVTPVLMPEGKDASSIRSALLAEYGINIAGSQIDLFKKTLVRIGHVGYVSRHDIERVLRALSILLR